MKISNLLFLAILCIVVNACNSGSQSMKNETSEANLQESDSLLIDLAGKFFKNGVDNKKMHLKLVPYKNDFKTAPKYATSNIFNSDSVDFQLPDVKKGMYTLYIFVDVNGNADSIVNPIPDSGDFVFAQDVTLEEDVLNCGLQDEHWITFESIGKQQ